jgi:ribosomal protein S12 methylthiotransferase
VKFYLLTLGCPKNVVDSEAMSELLRGQGHEAVATPVHADLLIVNTCGFLASAREEALEELRRLAAGKRHRQKLIAAGCLAQRDGTGILRQVPEVDALLGTRRWMEISRLVEQLAMESVRRPSQAVALLGDPSPDSPSPADRPPAAAGWAYLKISDGCDASCAFCTIPSIKGPLRSRPIEGLVSEARGLVARGALEIILIGQDTTAYGRDLGVRDGPTRLAQALLRDVADLRWLRLMYAYPGHVSQSLIEVMAQDVRVCHYLDLPLQHAHPATLRRMGRPANVDSTLRLIERLRLAMPDITLRSTLIVGYPGETETEFQTLLDFLREVEMDKVGAFTFSAEPGTAAAALPHAVPEDVKHARHDALMKVQQGISLRCNQQQLGRRLDVLIEGVGDGLSVGRSYRDAPEIDGLVLIPTLLPVARIAPVLITGAMEYDLMGEPA